MTFANEVYQNDIMINEFLIVSFSRPKKDSLINSKILFIAGFSGCGKSSLVHGLKDKLPSYYNIPERRIITNKCIIEPMLEEKQSLNNYSERTDRVGIVKKFKENIPEGIIYGLKNIDVKNINPAGFIFDGIRGESEMNAALEAFPNAKIIHLTANDEVRKERIAGRKDQFDNAKNEKDLNFIISKDYEIHKKEININTKYTDKVLTIDTSGLAMKEVLNTAYDWSLN